MNKCHQPITWHNDTTPAINETNLNYEDGCIDTIDDRVVAMDTSKANQSDLLKAFKDVSLNTTTGVITFTLFDNTTKTIDTLLEKVAINFDYDDDPTSPYYQNLIIELEDGTYKYIDMSALITEYEFTTSDTIAFTVDQDGAVLASVRDGSITGAKLQPNYLADVTAQANIASGAATSATNKATLAESYAVGGTGTRAGEDTDNAKYYKEQAQAIAAQQLGGLTDVSISNPQDGDLLTYDADNSEWKNSSDLKDSIDYLYNNTGGKNLNSYPYYETTKATNGLTFTDNGDGTVTVTGTASADTYFICHHRFPTWTNALIVPNGTYILNGCPTGGSASSFGIVLADSKKSDGSYEELGYDYGSGVQFTLNGDYYSNDNVALNITISIKSGTALPVGGITFKPMLRDVSISDDTYVPYAKTNKELTQEQVKNTDLTSIIATGSTNTTGAQINSGSYFYLNGVFCKALSNIASNASFTKNTNYKETTIAAELIELFNS